MSHSLIFTLVLKECQKGTDRFKQMINQPRIFDKPNQTSTDDVKLIEDVTPKFRCDFEDPSKYTMVPVPTQYQKVATVTPNGDKQKGKLSIKLKIKKIIKYYRWNKKTKTKNKTAWS